VLEIRDLVKHFQVGEGKPIHAVDGVSMDVAAGESVALYGPSGSGKTTLIDLIAGLKRPDSGSVRVDGRDVVAMSASEAADYRRKDIGIVLAPQTLMAGTKVIRNASIKLIMEGVRDAERKAEPLLAQLGLGDRLQHRTGQLSMGERQRVLIAIALSLKPKLMLADEPTASLDTERTREVLGLLHELCHSRNMALLLVTHDPEAAAFADRLLELRDGRVQAYQPDHASAPVGASRPGCERGHR
jgi:putative ABC transport system ATP-binding protein